MLQLAKPVEGLKVPDNRSELERLGLSALDRARNTSVGLAPPRDAPASSKIFTMLFDALGGNNPQRRQSAIRTAEALTGSGARTILDFVPVAGDALSASDARRAFQEGRMGEGLLLGGLTALGMVPLIGDVAAKAGKKAVKSANDMIAGLPGRNELNVWIESGEDAISAGWSRSGEPVIVLDKIYIDPQNRGKGYGREILRKKLDELADEHPGMDVKLLAEPLDDSIDLGSLIEFYESLGFSVGDYQEGMSGIPMELTLPKRR